MIFTTYQYTSKQDTAPQLQKWIPTFAKHNSMILQLWFLKNS